MKAKIRIESITSTLASGLILLNLFLAGCSKEDDSTTSVDLQIVPPNIREWIGNTLWPYAQTQSKANFLERNDWRVLNYVRLVRSIQ